MEFIFPILEYGRFLRLGLPVDTDLRSIESDTLNVLEATAISLTYEKEYFFAVVGHNSKNKPIYRTTLFRQLGRTIFSNEQEAQYALQTFPKKGDQVIGLRPDGTYKKRKVAGFRALLSNEYTYDYADTPDWVTFFKLEGSGAILFPISEYGVTILPDIEFAG